MLTFRAESHGPVEIVGVDNAAVWALFAAALSPSDVIHKPDIGAFSGTDDDYIAKIFVPGNSRPPVVQKQRCASSALAQTSRMNSSS